MERSFQYNLLMTLGLTVGIPQEEAGLTSRGIVTGNDGEIVGTNPPAPQRGTSHRLNNGLVRFGNFEVNLRSGELHKSGLKIKLHGQPFAVLALLLEQPGEVVTREELQQKLWTSDTFVDFEQGLNKAINKLREALGDEADRPRFIETLPRRGYRFVAPLKASTMLARESEAKPQAVSPRRSSRRLWMVGLGLTFLCVFGFAAFYSIRSARPIPRVLGYRSLTTDRHLKGLNPCGQGTPLLTDGPRIFFTEPNAALAQVSSNGGEVVKIPVPFPCFNLSAISPNGAELLGTSQTTAAIDQPIWVLPVTGMAPRRLGNLVGHSAIWSPDGKDIAYAIGNDVSDPGQVFIARKDGSNARKLVDFPQGRIGTINWSPDGKVLRISLLASQACYPWEVSVDGTNLHRWPVFSDGVCNASWTHDGKYSILSAHDAASNGWHLWALREARASFFSKTSAPIQLTTGGISFYGGTLSRDNQQIFAVGGQTRGELVRFDKTGKPEPYLSGMSAEHLDFSRDGKWVTYISYPESVLWRSNLDGSDRIQLTMPPLYVVLPQWSPDGTHITFTGQLPGQHWKIYVIPANGGSPRVVSEDATDEIESTWAPDGNSLIFGRSRYATNPAISSVDLQSGRVSSIPESEGLYSARKSPDGRYITAMSTPGERKLMLFDTQKQQWSILAEGKTFGFGWVRWATDSKHVYATVFELGTNRYSLYRVEIAKRKLERLSTVELPEGTTGTWGPWMGVTPDGSPLLLRDLGVHEIYAIDVSLP